MDGPTAKNIELERIWVISFEYPCESGGEPMLAFKDEQMAKVVFEAMRETDNARDFKIKMVPLI